jgi:hypothetical protein
MTSPHIVTAYNFAAPFPEYEWTAEDKATPAIPCGFGRDTDEAERDFLHNWNEAQDATRTAN